MLYVNIQHRQAVDLSKSIISATSMVCYQIWLGAAFTGYELDIVMCFMYSAVKNHGSIIPVLDDYNNRLLNYRYVTY